MFEMLSKYRESGQFEFMMNDYLRSVCNIPADNEKTGVYIISTKINNHKKVIYIGRSGEKKGDKIKSRKNGLRGRICINGKQFGDVRSKSWGKQMAIEFFDILFVQWWNTENDCPRAVEKLLLKEFKAEYKHLPLWNDKE